MPRPSRQCHVPEMLHDAVAGDRHEDPTVDAVQDGEDGRLHIILAYTFFPGAGLWPAIFPVQALCALQMSKSFLRTIAISCRRCIAAAFSIYVMSPSILDYLDFNLTLFLRLCLRALSHYRCTLLAES